MAGEVEEEAVGWCFEALDEQAEGRWPWLAKRRERGICSNLENDRWRWTSRCLSFGAGKMCVLRGDAKLWSSWVIKASQHGGIAVVVHA
jgi:hypothetical protein